mmetsp:Transcript_66388/g.74371  ORF Transcript_66388/g.74371 Transcript_66388/m.74371 type:complete len:92 (+) Transcript_66388:2029-2304(+)
MYSSERIKQLCLFFLTHNYNYDTKQNEESMKKQETEILSTVSFLSFQETTEDHPTSGVSHATSCIYTLYIYISYGVWCHQLMFAENTNKMK